MPSSTPLEAILETSRGHRDVPSSIFRHLGANLEQLGGHSGIIWKASWSNWRLFFFCVKDPHCNKKFSPPRGHLGDILGPSRRPLRHLAASWRQIGNHFEGILEQHGDYFFFALRILIAIKNSSHLRPRMKPSRGHLGDILG